MSDKYLGIEVKPHPGNAYGKTCPKCEGHGRWNIQIDAYGKGHHFQMVCGACNGRGYLRKGQTCTHEWHRKANIGKCLNLYACKHCGEQKAIDSSD